MINLHLMWSKGEAYGKGELDSQMKFNKKRFPNIVNLFPV